MYTRHQGEEAIGVDKPEKRDHHERIPSQNKWHMQQAMDQRPNTSILYAMESYSLVLSSVSLSLYFSVMAT